MIIKPLTTLEEINQIPELEKAIWETTPDESVPPHVLLTIAVNGGVLLGAFEDEKLIGYTLGWLGIRQADEVRPAAENLKLVSHMAGVLREYRDRRIGNRLKLAQREWALARKLELVTWTYDPLESRNANLNIRQLGTTCTTYLRDHYGELADRINTGLATDRFKVDWWIAHRHVVDRLAKLSPADTLITGAQLLNPARIGADELLYPCETPLEITGPRLLVEIPPNIQIIRQTDLGLAAAWRSQTRELFEKAFAAGYQVVDFIYTKKRPQSFYLLTEPVTPVY